MKTELEKFSDQMALMEMCVQLEDEQKKIFDALPKLKDEFSKEAKAEFARLTKQAEAIEWKLAEARGEYLKTVESNRAEFARMEQNIKAKGTELAEYSKRLQSEVPAPVEQKIKAIFETLPRPANGKDGANGKDASLLTGFRGNWDADTTYKAGDWFTFRGSSYLVLRACKGQIPAKNAQGEPNAYYAVFAMSGAPGPNVNGLYLPTGGGTITGNLEVSPLVNNQNGTFSVGQVYTASLRGMTTLNGTLVLDAVGFAPSFFGRRFGTSFSAPSAVTNGQGLFTINGGGYNGTSVSDAGASVSMAAAAGWSATSTPGKINLSTVAVGSTSNSIRVTVEDFGALKLGVVPPTVGTAAWGVAGVILRTTANTWVDNASSGTVAVAVGSSFAVPTFAASAATTFTDAANLYIAGDVAAGTNATLTNSYGLWNVGKTRLDGAVTINAALAIGNTVSAGVAVASTHKITMVIGGNTYYLLASNV